MQHLRVPDAASTGAKCRIYGCQTLLVCFTCKHFVRFSFVCSGKCDIFAIGQVGGLCRKRMMPMRPCLSPRRAFLQVFQLATKEGRVGNEARHNKGVYLTLCLRQSEIFQSNQYQGLELSNGRCSGCDYINTMWHTVQAIVAPLLRCDVIVYMRHAWFGFSYRRGL